MINRLRVLRNVLSQARDVIKESLHITNPEAFSRIEHFIRVNAGEWREKVPRLNYADPFCRMAYLYRNVPVHAALVERALRHFPEIKRLVGDRYIAGHALRVCALGGGPGSELIGLIRFLESLIPNGPPIFLDIALIDNTPEWDDSWHALKDGIDQELIATHGPNPAIWPAVISRSFLALDLSDVHQIDRFATRFINLDIVIACYVVSELLGSIDGLREVIEYVVKQSAPGTLILFIDRDEEETRTAVTSILGAIPQVQALTTRREQGDLEDDLREFGEWFIEVEPIPRKSWRAFFTLARRVE